MEINYSNHKSTEVQDYVREGINAYLVNNPLSVSKLALEIGIDRMTLAKWLRGHQVSYTTLTKIMTWLKGQQ